MMEFAKVVSVVHHRVRADLPETSQHCGSGRSDLKGPLTCATIGKCYYFLSFAFFFCTPSAALCTENMTAISSQMAKSRTLVCLVFVLAAIASSWCWRRLKL